METKTDFIENLSKESTQVTNDDQVKFINLLGQTPLRSKSRSFSKKKRWRKTKGASGKIDEEAVEEDMPLPVLEPIQQQQRSVLG